MSSSCVPVCGPGYRTAPRSAGSVFFTIANVLTLAAVLLLAWNATNAQFEHTFLLPAAAPGTLASERFSVFWWLWQAALGAGIILVPLAALVIAAPWNGAYRIGHLLWAIATLALMIAFIVFHAFEIDVCNRATASSPVCDDLRWCCVYGAVFPDPPDAICPYLLAPCAPAVVPADLAWRGSFLLSFILTIVLIVFALLHIVFNVVVGRAAARTRAPTAEDGAPLVSPAEDADLDADIGARVAAMQAAAAGAPAEIRAQQFERELEKIRLAQGSHAAYKMK